MESSTRPDRWKWPTSESAEQDALDRFVEEDAEGCTCSWPTVAAPCYHCSTAKERFERHLASLPRDLLSTAIDMLSTQTDNAANGYSIPRPELFIGDSRQRGAYMVEGKAVESDPFNRPNAHLVTADRCDCQRPAPLELVRFFSTYDESDNYDRHECAGCRGYVTRKRIDDNGIPWYQPRRETIG